MNKVKLPVLPAPRDHPTLLPAKCVISQILGL